MPVHKRTPNTPEYSSLFGALQSQGVSRPYLKLLAALYCNQTGDVNGRTFPIQRGVKQGDVISLLLFNAGLEHAMRKWKLRLQHCGFDLGNSEILTNVMYADDLMLYAKHCDELIFMMEMLIEELSAVGLHLNTSKTKILTTTALTDRMFLDVGGDMIEVVHGQETFSFFFASHLFDRCTLASHPPHPFRIGVGAGLAP